MAGIDLSGIHFRAYLPQFDRDLEEYAPVGPGDANRTSGGIDISAIKFRAWQQNDISSDQASGGDGGGSTGGGGGGSNAATEVIWPYDEIINNNSVPIATITILETIINSENITNTIVGTITIADVVNGSVIESISNSATGTISIA